MTRQQQTVLILGAGINGAAIARELALQGLSVCMVDTADVSAGATAYSSRLIHGGLRYLEYGEWALVRESLAERSRLLRYAPQFVKPLRLSIPVTNRFGGLWQAVCRIWGKEVKSHRPRGLWTVRLGLWFYELFGRDPLLLGCTAQRADDRRAQFPRHPDYRWWCSYDDAQIQYAERFVISLLRDAQQLAAERGSGFELWTYHQAQRRGAEVRIVSNDSPHQTVKTLSPAVVINATGAWVDETLQQWEINTPLQMGGTKGSHFLTSQAKLRGLVAQHGIYAEAEDGRPVFILPFGEHVLVGTTDIPFDGDPRTARASKHELDYLLHTVNHILPEVRLTQQDIDQHYSGVRPLPAARGQKASAITRRHWLQEHADTAWPIYSVIGGKLTTCRSLAEQTAHIILQRLNHKSWGNTRERYIPGAENYPATNSELRKVQQALAVEQQCSVKQVAAVWKLCGSLTKDFIKNLSDEERISVSGTYFPRGFVKRVMGDEWVKNLEDVVERRLMLVFSHPLSRQTLLELAALLVDAGRISADQVDQSVEETCRRLHDQFGKNVVTS